MDRPLCTHCIGTRCSSQVCKSITTYIAGDHYPLSICIDVDNIPKVETIMQHPTVICNLGKANESQLSEYITNYETLLISYVSLDCESIYCTNTVYSDLNHKHSIETYMGA